MDKTNCVLKEARNAKEASKQPSPLISFYLKYKENYLPRKCGNNLKTGRLAS